MPKYSSDPEKQPVLLPEDRLASRPAPEDQEDKEAYRQRLRACLRDPDFRKIEGFPIGEDEAILALSDPPYYTACPNPFLGEIVEKWQRQRAELRKELGLPDDSRDNGSSLPGQGERPGVRDQNLPSALVGEGTGVRVYHREPFASDVSEGKNDPIYNAHSYHTKVPHKAIMRYILHYTDPGDIVLDGFCGTGMTGVAAQLCGDRKTVESLGYYVDRDGWIYEGRPSPPSPLVGEGSGVRGQTPPSPLVGEGMGVRGQKPISRLGARKAVLVDLSPASTFIAYNYNTPVDAKAFEREARRILKEVEGECGWMYETWHIPPSPEPGRGAGGEGVKGKINYTVWSDVFLCPQCGGEMVFWQVAVDHEKGAVRGDWDCPHCNARLSKSPKKGSGALRAERAFETRYDRALGRTVRMAKQAPVLINYSVGKKRYEKRPDPADLALLAKIEQAEIPYPFPIQRMPEGDESRRNDDIGLTHVHHFYTRRNLWALAAIYSKAREASKNTILFLIFAFQQLVMGMSKWGRYVPSHYSQVNQGLSGTLYIASQVVEVSPEYIMTNKVSRLATLWSITPYSGMEAIITSQSANLIDFSDASIDYIFVDPPFGANLMYSELNFLWEAWLGVFTNNQPEAVVNKTQRKGLPEYQALMEACFREFFRLLKPGRWMTVEFHNSQNSVWNAIQEAILQAGFMVADVRTLDKQQGTFKQVTTTAAVKQDLIISAYKPRTAFERQFLSEGGSVQGAWAFIRQHLEQLPLPAVENGVVETLTERQAYLLYDRMVAFHLMRGLAVPLSAVDFYQGLHQRFLERDGMYFTPEQAAEYDKRRLGAQQVEQLSLFVTDEKSAIQWLRRELDPATGAGPQTYQDLQPKFLRELHQARYEALPELRAMLEDNFLQDAGGRWYAPDPDRQADLEALRQKALLREYNEYLKGKSRLKVFRSEAVRAGFSHYWKQRDYEAILKVADRLPSNVLEEDQQLLMYVHNAGLRRSQQPKQERLL